MYVLFYRILLQCFYFASGGTRMMSVWAVWISLKYRTVTKRFACYWMFELDIINGVTSNADTNFKFRYTFLWLFLERVHTGDLWFSYTGAKCDQKCSPGLWGVDCISRCRCKNSAECDATNGECICASGWKGEFCNQSMLQLCYMCGNCITCVVITCVVVVVSCAY